jgi:hypothetical protein
MGKATPHPADRQPCGYRSAHQRGAPGTSRFEIEWNILEGRERSWGLGFGSFFFVFGCLFCVSVVRSRLFVCTFWLHNLVLCVCNHLIFANYKKAY